ncbi:MAG TPA: LptA/OstA family protein, partial [Vicinamibacterales bacterium]
MWLKRLRLGIALFVVIFATVVVVSLRRGHNRTTQNDLPVRQDPKASVESQGGTYKRTQQGKTTFTLKFGGQLTYADGRSKLSRGVEVTFLDKDGRTVKIESQDANLLNPPDQGLTQAEFLGGAKMSTSDGVTISGAEATYDKKEDIVRIPGAIKFSKGRMTGSGVGGSYDFTREMLSVLDQVQADVAPDAKGEGVTHVTSRSAVMSRQEHYVKFTTDARLDGEGRLTQSDEVTLWLSEDDKLVQRMELRGHSSITATGQGNSGPQSMAADNIDLAYAEDGRTLKTSKLMEKAVVQLPGQPGAAGRRIAGRTIDITMASDGSTVTGLNAVDTVQVNLPAEGDTPAREIRAAALAATGAEGAGLQNAKFTGNVDYHESRAAKKGVAAIERTARSQRLDVQTKPGLGDLQRAEFHGNVHFTDGADTSADAPMAVYDVGKDQLELLPSAGDPGTGPHVANERITVDAAHIQMTLGSESLTADTKVRGVMQSQSQNRTASAAKPAARGARGGPATVAPLPPAQNAQSVRMPAMLKQNEPVNVTANRLEYDGGNSRATYTGSARLWQTETVVQADRIVLDDKTGNLHATTNVRTVMTLAESTDAKDQTNKKPAARADDKTKKPPTRPTTTVAEDLVYEDDSRKATYTTKAHMNGPDGDLTADRIELYLSESGGELERAEADGNVVSREPTRRAYGDHLTYIAAKDDYTMVGKPVKVFDDAPPDCKVTYGTTLTFHKAVDTISATGNGVSAGTRTETIACG